MIKELQSELEVELESIIASLDCKLYDVSFIRENDSHILRVSIVANDGHTTLDKCQLVSEVISPFLDVKDIMTESYILEVSSPGVERVLKTPRHFRFSLGEKVNVRLMDRSEFEAVLDSVGDNEIGFKLENGECRSVKYGELKKVKTIFEW